MKRLLSFLLAFSLLFGAFELCGHAQSPNAAKLVAITFDDGPSAYTASLLNGLRARNAKATFFVAGANGPSCGAKYYPDILKRIVSEGHELANHTSSHYVPFDALSDSSMRKEVDAVNQYLFKAAGRTYRPLVRTPGGATSKRIFQSIEAPIILWDVDTRDWESRNADAVYRHIVNDTSDGSIVLLHDLYPTSIQGALSAIDTLQARGYECVTVSELFRRRGITLQKGKAYYAAYNRGITLPAYQPSDYELVFDAAYYAARYPDLKKAFGSDEYALLTHFLQHGLKEGRQAGPLFSVTYYKKAYPDLAASCKTPADYVAHFMNTGVKKGYRASEQFDPVSYRLRYVDLRSAFSNRWESYYRHYLQNGLREKRNPLHCTDMKQYTTVYNGVNYAAVYDYNSYVKRYPDIYNAFGYDDRAVLKHFVTYGMNEGRIGCSKFQVHAYRARYSDLRKAFGTKLKPYYLHYLQHGKREGRKAV